MGATSSWVTMRGVKPAMVEAAKTLVATFSNPTMPAYPETPGPSSCQPASASPAAARVTTIAGTWATTESPRKSGKCSL